MMASIQGFPIQALRKSLPIHSPRRLPYYSDQSTWLGDEGKEAGARQALGHFDASRRPRIAHLILISNPRIAPTLSITLSLGDVGRFQHEPLQAQDPACRGTQTFLSVFSSVGFRRSLSSCLRL